jgi:ketosteroid isomerase-like protein
MNMKLFSSLRVLLRNMLLRNMLLLGIAVLCLARAGMAQPSAPAKTLSPLEQSLIGTEKNFLAAVKKGDAAYLQRTFTEDFAYVETDGQLHERQEVIDDLGDGGTEIAPYNFKVVAAGDNTAIVTYDATLQVPPEEDQGPPPRYQHCTSIWVKHAGEWKLKFQQTTPTHWGDW